MQTLIERFDDAYNGKQKECVNLVGFLTELYNFGVVGAGLVYDLVRMFMEDLSEFSTELLLKVIQSIAPSESLLMRLGTTVTTGRSFRFEGYSDSNASANHSKGSDYVEVASLRSRFNVSVRTKFMVETIINLKNNRAKAVTATSVVSSEVTIRMKKFLGKMGEKSLRSGGEPLRVTLSDIRNVKEKGKWWLVGASWKSDDLPLRADDSAGKEEDALLSVARDQRMNTEIRRAVFIALMGSDVLLTTRQRVMVGLR